MDPRDELVVVYVCQGLLGAEVARGKLESNNIRAILRYSPLGRALGITVDGLGEVTVLVRVEDATAAQALLAEEPTPEGLAPSDTEETET